MVQKATLAGHTLVSHYSDKKLPLLSISKSISVSKRLALRGGESMDTFENCGRRPVMNGEEYAVETEGEVLAS